MRLAPWLMKLLTVAGTAAMFLVGGGILVHGVPALHHLAHGWQAAGGLTGALLPLLLNAGAGLAAGALLVAAMHLLHKARQ